MLTRDEMRFYSAGVYYYQNRGETLDAKKIENFVGGAMMAYDLLTKNIKNIEELKRVEAKPLSALINAEENSQRLN